VCVRVGKLCVSVFMKLSLYESYSRPLSLSLCVCVCVPEFESESIYVSLSLSPSFSLCVSMYNTSVCMYACVFFRVNK